VVTIRWGIRRDRPGRQAWRQSRIEAAAEGNVRAPFGSGRTAVQDPAKDP